MNVIPVQLNDQQLARVVALLTESFTDDLLVTIMCGQSVRRRRNLFRLTVRMQRDMSNPVLGIEHDNRLVGVALVGEPGVRPGNRIRSVVVLGLTVSPLVALRQILPRREPDLPIPAERHVLHLLAVHPDYRGQGLGRKLISAVHDLVRSHPSSAGVFLQTGMPDNVGLYRHLGYRIVGRTRVAKTDWFYMFWSKQ